MHFPCYLFFHLVFENDFLLRNVKQNTRPKQTVCNMYYLTVGKPTTCKHQTLPTVVKGVHTKVIKQAMSSQESDPLLKHDSGQIPGSVSASTPAVSSMLPSSVSASIPAQDFPPALPVRPNPQEIRESLPMQSHKSLVSSPPMQSHRGPVSSSNTAQHPREPVIL